ncbi:CLUMA_CG000879, isoform A [Clunio marinus]|uniref:CLUMA_CG000879, isoform A n=1 Tax=Clunio marinus TaxID=568069 RepID=A0A1J1HGG5_9DIPT|nr:CLUMA_CG000879, isoform A [Clunio marinus]
MTISFVQSRRSTTTDRQFSQIFLMFPVDLMPDPFVSLKYTLMCWHDENIKEIYILGRGDEKGRYLKPHDQIKVIVPKPIESNF